MKVLRNNKQNDIKVNYTFAEVAEYLGITELELINFSIEQGLLDKNGMPTDFAIEQGLFKIEKLTDNNLRIDTLWN